MSTVKNVISIIENDGIPMYVKPFLKLVKSMSADELRDLYGEDSPNFEKKMTNFVRLYHKHCHFESDFNPEYHNPPFQETQCQMLKSGIAKITLFTFELSDEKVSKQYTDYIVSFLDANPLMKGLVLDFRKHKGGNMWPLVKALQRYLNDSSLFAWTIHRNPLGKNGWINWIKGKWKTDQPFLVGSTPKYPIAVLIGPQTASSGEFVASCFINRPNCMLFGKQTRGYLSGNETRHVHGYAFTFPTVLQTSRDGKYQEHIDPDVVTTRPLKDAIDWITAS
jgi:C-terminal processing protease CtpA/Prc